MGGFGWIGGGRGLERRSSELLNPLTRPAISGHTTGNGQSSPLNTQGGHNTHIQVDSRHRKIQLFFLSKLPISDGVGSAGELFWDTYNLRVHRYLCLKLSV